MRNVADGGLGVVISLLVCASLILIGWGLDDDVYFAETQNVKTFLHEAEDERVKAIKPVKRVVHDAKVVTSMNGSSSRIGNWGLPNNIRIEDLMGFE